jgi:hypothetical protein
MRLDDPRWQSLHGGYRITYDASQALCALEAGDDGAFDSLWKNLHHQGAVGEASYAALPSLVRIGGARQKRDWNFYGLINVIEVCRHESPNPPLPTWLSFEYRSALRDLLVIALADIPHIDDKLTLQQALASIALSKRETRLGELLATLTSDEIDEILDGSFGV